jgi:signal transduction histidine kinase
MKASCRRGLATPTPSPPIGYEDVAAPEFANDAVMREEFLERMERQGDRLQRLVENLLTASASSRQLPPRSGVLSRTWCAR